MEKVIELYYLLRDVDIKFDEMYNTYLKRTAHAFISIYISKFEYITNIIVEISKKLIFSPNSVRLFKFNIFNYYVSIQYDGYIISLIDTVKNKNKYINISYDNKINNIFCYYNEHIFQYIKLYKNIDCYMYPLNMLILILSTQRNISSKQRLPPEIYNYIYCEFIEPNMLYNIRNHYFFLQK